MCLEPQQPTWGCLTPDLAERDGSYSVVDGLVWCSCGYGGMLLGYGVVDGMLTGYGEVMATGYGYWF